MSAIGVLPAQQGGPAREGMRLADGVTSWRKVFDREQMAALDKFRSVEAPALARMASARPGPGGVGGGNVQPALTEAATTSGPGKAAASAARFSPGAQLTMMPAASGASPQYFPAQGSTGFSSRAVLAGMPVRPGEGAGPMSLAAPLAALLEKWPSRKLHCMARADGLHLWLRDSSVVPHDPALQRWLTDLQGALAMTGMPLARFTLNGRACPAAAIVSIDS